jgi:hypothetical protein
MREVLTLYSFLFYFLIGTREIASLSWIKKKKNLCWQVSTGTCKGVQIFFVHNAEYLFSFTNLSKLFKIAKIN